MTHTEQIPVLEAAGKTLEELRAHFRFELVHEEDPTDPRPLVRILRFANLTQAIEFAQLFDPISHADVWFTQPDDVTALFDQPVSLSVVFHHTTRPAIVHGTDDMRQVAHDITQSRPNPQA